MSDLSPINPDKSSLRKQAINQRARLPIEEISQALCAHLATWPHFGRAQEALFYYPFRNEVDLRPLCRQHPEKSWYLPAVTQGHEMVFRRVNMDLQLSPGRYGIAEPPDTAPQWTGPALASEASCLILVPGLLYDWQGYRLGYGKGYYDRFLSLPQLQSQSCLTVGVAPQALVRDCLQHDPWDVPMDYLVTERGIHPVNAIQGPL